MEEEALGWSLLFSDRVIFLHPFPLDLPESCRPLLDRKVLQVLTPSRTAEEIREKDRRLREFRAFVTQNPDFSFLETLKQSVPAEPLETRDEILEQLRGGSPVSGRNEGFPREDAGGILLCLIHDWISQQWEIDRSLDRFASQEKALAEIMEAGFEFSGDWTAPGTAFVAPADPELVCPPALEAWRKLKEQLAPAAPFRLTTQQWVWKDQYHLDPEDAPSPALSLPGWVFASVEAFLGASASWTAAGLLQPIRRMFWELASGSSSGTVEDLQGALKTLALPEAGRYVLTFPPFPGPASGGLEPLLLLRQTF
ncbi:MAG: hypothetical protein HY892_04545 [Deltaproteobacteria bacterium]|nr:hypothetical protein [Deltaproteobacteria bacterium]